jgi:MFS family permease
MSFNVAALPVSLGGMVASFERAADHDRDRHRDVLARSVAGFVMLGAKLVQRFGSTAVFRVVVGLFGVAQVLMVGAGRPRDADGAAAGGLAAAVIVPALVALIAHHYRGPQQATAVGALGSARAGAGVAAFLIGGMLGTFIGWRPVFGILVVLAGIVFFLSFRLKPEEAAARGEDRHRRRAARRDRDHHDRLRLQQPQPLGPRRGAAGRALRRLRHVAGAADDRHRHHPAAGLHRLVPARRGARAARRCSTCG